jgi:YesN/AraC family two-component response regulator
MNDYLSKPMKKAQLEAILNKWLQAASRKAA